MDPRVQPADSSVGLIRCQPLPIRQFQPPQQLPIPLEIRRIIELVNVESTDQISVVVLRQGFALAAMSPEAAYLSGGVIVRSSKPRDWRGTAKALAEQMPFVDTKYAGQPYSMVVIEARSFGYFTPDDRTVVIAA